MGFILKLPNGAQAVVEIEKLRDYCLNPEHLQGQHKARVFAASLNFTTGDAEALRKLLLEAARTSDAVATKHDNYGQRFIIDFKVEQKGKSAVVRSAWIIRNDENFPRLTTCYVL